MDRSYLRYVPRDTCGVIASNGVCEEGSRAKFPDSFFGKHGIRKDGSTRILFSAQAERVRILNLDEDAKVLASLDVAPREIVQGAPVYYSSNVTTMKLSHDGTRLAVGYADGSIRIWMWKDTLNKGQEDAGGDLTKLDLNPRQNLLYKRPAFGYKTHDDLFTNDGRDDDYETQLDYGVEAEPTVALTGHNGAVQCLQWTMEDETLISGGVDGEIVVWDTDRLDGKFRLSGHTGPINEIQILYTTTSTSRATRELPSFRTFDPSRPGWLVSASQDSTMRLWDLEIQTCIHTEAVHRREVISMAIDRCNRRLVSVGSDGNVYLHVISNLPGDLDHKPKSDVQFHLLGHIVRDLRGGKVVSGRHAPAELALVGDLDQMNQIRQMSRSSNVDAGRKRKLETKSKKSKKRRTNEEGDAQEVDEQEEIDEDDSPFPVEWSTAQKQNLCAGAIRLVTDKSDTLKGSIAIAFDVDLKVFILPRGSISGRIESYSLLSFPSALKKLKKRLKNTKKRREAMIKKIAIDQTKLESMRETLPIADNDSQRLEFRLAEGELKKQKALVTVLMQELEKAGEINKEDTHFLSFNIADLLALDGSRPCENTRKWLVSPFHQRLQRKPSWKRAMYSISPDDTTKDSDLVIPQYIVTQVLTKGSIALNLINPALPEQDDDAILERVETLDSQSIPTAPKWLLPLRNDEGFVTGGEAGQFKVWDLKSQRCVATRELESSKMVLSSALLLPDNEHILAATSQRDVIIISISTGETFATVEMEDEEIVDMCLDSEGKGFFVVTKSSQVRYFVLTAKKGEDGEDQLITTEVRSKSLQFEPKRVIATPDGKYICVVQTDDTIVLFHTNTLKLFVTLYGHKLPVRSIAVSDDSSMIATAGDEKTVFIWGTDFGQIMKRLTLAHEGSVTALSFIPESHLLVSAGSDQRVKFWDVDSKKCIQSLDGHCAYITSMGILTDGGGVITCDASKIVRTWFRTREPLMIKDEMRAQLELKDEASMLKDVNNKSNLFADVTFSKASRPSNDTIRSAEQVSEVVEKCWEAVILMENGQDLSDLHLESNCPLAHLWAKLRCIPNGHLFDCIVTLSQSDIKKLMEMITLLLEKLIKDKSVAAIEGESNKIQLYSFESTVRTALLIMSSHLRHYLFNDGSRALVHRLKSALSIILDTECDDLLCNMAACSLLGKQQSV